jgi:hypothetical protein
MLDEEFAQIALWVDPSRNDFYNPSTGASSADVVSAWGVPAGGLNNFTSYSLIRNLDDDVKFDRMALAIFPR